MIRKILRTITKPILVWVLNWTASQMVQYFDVDKDGKVSKNEIKAVLGPSVQVLVKKLK